MNEKQKKFIRLMDMISQLWKSLPELEESMSKEEIDECLRYLKREP